MGILYFGVIIFFVIYLLIFIGCKKNNKNLINLGTFNNV